MTRTCACVCAITIVCVQSVVSPVAATEPYRPFRVLVKEPFDAVFNRKRPETGEDDAIEQLAKEIDWLEHFVDTWGTVVAKQPDVWGEARLTKHREEYERVMFRELGKFDDRINGALSQSDQAYLASALALSNAAEGANAPELPPFARGQMTVVGATTSTGEIIRSDQRGAFSADRFENFENEAQIGLEPTTHLNQLSRYLGHLQELRRINEGDDTSDSPGYALNLVRIPVSVLPGKKTREGWGAEITITATPYLSDALLGNTFRNLVINDLVDQLGLTVTRVAEVVPAIAQQEEAKNRLLKELATLLDPLDAQIAALRKQVKEQQDISSASSDIVMLRTGIDLATTDVSDDEVKQRAIQEYADLEKTKNKSSDRLNKIVAAQNRFRKLTVAPKDDNGVAETDATNAQLPDERAWVDETQSARDAHRAANMHIEQLEIAIETTTSRIDELNSKRQEIIDQYQRQIDALNLRLQESALVPTAGARSRRARHPIPPTQVPEIFGISGLQRIAEGFVKTNRGRHVRWNGGGPKDKEQRAHLVDVQRFLQAEIEAAYELLAEPIHSTHWIVAVDSGLADDIRSRHRDEIESAQNLFFASIHDHDKNRAKRYGDEVRVERVLPRNAPEPTDGAVTTEPSNELTTTEVLAWAIVVESALLNEQLAEDIQMTAQSKGCLTYAGPHLKFYLPFSASSSDSMYAAEYQEASAAFNDYVRCRWPIHVFALDPVTEEQNIAEVSSRRRELQLALSLKFVGGGMSANSLTQFARRLEMDLEVISLNRTIVGFSHGNDTFGWRFAPRVQTPPPPSNVGAFFETLIGGPGREHDISRRLIEPGPRECTAVVLMPSFVPYCDFDVRSNWFRLVNSKESELEMHEVMKLSRSIKAMETSSAMCIQCAHLYRDGEVDRLMRRVHQLDRELPLQSMRVQIPYENTLGGFEMFNTGLTDLAPELIGWYGAPGVIIAAGEGTCSAGAAAKKSTASTAAATTTTAASPVSVSVTCTAAPAAPSPDKAAPKPSGTTTFDPVPPAPATARRCFWSVTTSACTTRV